MHDEVSETENIRKNLAIERMIVDGCELLLDVNQVFVRQGFTANDLERKTLDHPLTAGVPRATLCGPSASFTSTTMVIAQSQHSLQQQHSSLTSLMTGSVRATGGCTSAVTGESSVITPCTNGTSARIPTPSDSGPPVSIGPRRPGSNEPGQRHMSGSLVICSGTFSGSTSAILPTGSDEGSVHRHSTSLCSAKTAGEIESSLFINNARSVDRPDHRITESGTVLNSPSTTPASPVPTQTPLNLHRFSSNFTTLNASGGGSAAATAMGLVPSHSVSVNHPNCTLTPGANVEKTDYGNLDFRIVWEPKNGQPTSIWLVASTLQEKAAWCSDISQCIEQLHYGDLLNSAQSDVSSVAMPQSIRSDPRLFKDDVDIKFSHTLNSCKVPQASFEFRHD
ncbi:Ras-specific guanine nucleotide-releasing factor 1 [Fasciolopsis buskii]|uniref:Ras-specific guanine nucleotide-releasing factor 1 n=1 Tax=Fasciolopsis buskii TaxID=27845 RepID=A0A8E0RWD0_9TREM|nr:Ras-specific guanine nucleotide-releasing factor 1 [Fasciolopsis buski]